MHNSNTNKNVLITGGVGFIGTNAALKIAQQGWQVTVVDNFSRTGVELNHKTLQQANSLIQVIKADVQDVPRYLDDLKKADLVIHLAGQTAVTSSIKNPWHDFENNLLAGVSLLEAVRLHNPEAVMFFASTNKVYGDLSEHELKKNEATQRYENLSFPEGIDEQQRLEFISPYGCSKGSLDQYFLDFARIYGLKTVVFRQSCIYGPHQMGVEDQGWVAHFVKLILQCQPLTIFGDGYQVRDLLYVDDLLEAYLLAFRQINQVQGEAFNIGGGPAQAVSLLNLIKQTEDLTGIQTQILFKDARAGDQLYFVSDNSKLKKKLGWEPTTQLEDGLQSLIQWQQENII